MSGQGTFERRRIDYGGTWNCPTCLAKLEGVVLKPSALYYCPRMTDVSEIAQILADNARVCLLAETIKCEFFLLLLMSGRSKVCATVRHRSSGRHFVFFSARHSEEVREGFRRADKAGYLRPIGLADGPTYF